MNRQSCFAALALAAASGLATAEGADLSVNVAVPGVYGQLELGGDYPAPRYVYAQPIVIDRGPPGEPLYLHVPPGQERDWRRYCRQYEACGRPVYFVRDDWYRNVYAPRYHELHVRDERRGPPDRGLERREEYRDGDRGRPGEDRRDGVDRGRPPEERRGEDRRDDERR